MAKHLNSLQHMTLFFVGVVVFGALLSGCVDRANPETVAAEKVLPQVCTQGEQMTQTTLYFGLNRPYGSTISATEWQSFVDNGVTRRFKEGLTIIDAKGQWLGDDGKVVKESSKALMLIHKNDKDAAIEALRTDYKQQFAQESVMRVDAIVCVDF